jgi:hypothetical protein
MDGTVIIVTETPNGEAWNVMPAAYMNHGGSSLSWWGIYPSKMSNEPGEHPTKWRPLAITPVCWMPMPKPEAEATLRRRLSQLFRRNKTEN